MIRLKLLLLAIVNHRQKWAFMRLEQFSRLEFIRESPNWSGEKYLFADCLSEGFSELLGRGLLG